MKRFLTLAGLVLALGILVGPAPAQDKWGTLKGRVVWGGDEVPEPQDLTPLIMKNPDSEFCLKDGKVLDQRFVINKKNKGLQWAVVYLSNGDPKKKLPMPIKKELLKPDKNVVEIDQPVCMYVPHTIAIREGQTLLAKNNAKVSHNVLYVGPDGSGNPLLLPGKTFPLEGLTASLSATTLSCSIHPWMKAYVKVFDHPYFAVTDENGEFTIKDAPAGKYNLIIWQGNGGYAGGAAGRIGRVITIEPGMNDLGDREYPPVK